MQKLLYSRKETAQQLGLSVPMVDRLVKQGLLRPKYVGDRPCFSEKELQRFVYGRAQ